MRTTRKTGAKLRHTSAPPGIAKVRLKTTIARKRPTSSHGNPRRGRP